MKSKRRAQRLWLSVMLTLASLPVAAQNRWQPDSTAYHYLNRGAQLEQWQTSAGTRVEVDTTSLPRAIKWIIPAQTADAMLELQLIDIDLRGRILYTVCRRNNYPAPIIAVLLTGYEKGFRLHDPVYVDQSGKHLPVDLWQQRGTTISLSPFGGARPQDLVRARTLRFRANLAEAEQVLWIAEIKHRAPTGPAAIIHFNHYRDSADSLLTPWLLAQGYRANIDFTFEHAQTELRENRGESGIWTRYIGLARIAELVRNHGWSTSHHGTFYKILPELATEQRMQLYELGPFAQAGFATQWCFSIPSDEITPAIYVELLGLQRFLTIRRQGERRPNELPIDEPQQLRFFRPTSASAGPNVSGTPRTLEQMKAEVDEAFALKGLLIFDFGAIVTQPSPSYTGSEVTMLEDAQNLIRYADALGFTFLTFADLFAPDPDYQQTLSLNPDYALHKAGALHIPVLENDLAPAGETLRVISLSQPRFGEALIAQDQKSVRYSIATFSVPTTAHEDRFYYVASAGALTDTAWVFITVRRPSKVDEHEPPENFVFAQSYPNPFRAATRIEYELTQPAFVELEVYNLAGQLMTTLVRERKPAGVHQVEYRGATRAAGIYFYQLKVNGHVLAKNKLVRLH